MHCNVFSAERIHREIMRCSVKCVLCLFALLPCSILHAQENTFTKLEPRLQWHFNYRLEGDRFTLFFDSIPVNVDQTRFELKGPCYGTIVVDAYQTPERMRSVSLGGYCTKADTLYLFVYQSYDGLQYPVVRLFPTESYRVNLGADCYRLNCEPNNDPWMPSADDPFLICEHCHYLNWSNGRIMSGRRAIRLGLYDACEMKQWKYIIPEARYRNKAGVSISGAKLISKGYIRRKHWNREAF
jgi:hypothetical protein